MDVAIDKNNTVVGVCSKDNIIVTTLSNEYGRVPLQKYPKYSAKENNLILPNNFLDNVTVNTR